MRVVFWGTPEFATPPLRALLGEGFEVAGVVTQTDKAVGRSRSTVASSPVKRVALEEGLPVLQPARPRGDDFVRQLRELEPDLSVVVAYGHLLPRDVIDLPPHGTLNVHASLLPALRGASPIQGAILAGLRETGVTIMQMVPALDAGPIRHAVPTPILEDETFGELQQRLAELGALALIEALAMLDAGQLPSTPQNESLATYAGKIDRARTELDWSRTADEICRTIRAFDPRPGAHTTLAGTSVKLFGARAIERDAGEPGEVLAVTESGLAIATGRGAVRVAEVQPAGKRRLSSADWARGRGIAVGDRLGRESGRL